MALDPIHWEFLSDTGKGLGQAVGGYVRSQKLSALGDNPQPRDLARALLELGDSAGAQAAMNMDEERQARAFNQNLAERNFQAGRSDTGFNQGAEVARIRIAGDQADTTARMAGLQPGFAWDPNNPGQQRRVTGGPHDPAQIEAEATARQPDKLDDQQSKADVARVGELTKEGDQGRGLVSDVAEMRALRQGLPPYVGFPGAGTIGKADAALGGLGNFNSQHNPSAVQALDAKATDFKLNLSGKLKGAISDKEQVMLGQGTPGSNMSDAAAQTVLNGYEAAGLRKQERGKFYRAYLQKNRTLDGADDTWDRFIAENPLIARNDKGEIAVNRENVGKWGGYVASSKPPAASGSKATAPAEPSKPNAAVRFRQLTGSGLSKEDAYKKMTDEGY